MGLTSGLFGWLTIIAAVGFGALTVWLWPRLARQRPTRIASRAGLVIGGQALVLIAVVTLLNDSFGFFGSWSELLGSGTVRQVWTAGAGTAASPARLVTITGSSIGTTYLGGSALHLSGGQLATGPGASALTARAGAGKGAGANSPARSGAVLRITVHGQYSGISEYDEYVYLPPQYFQPAYARARFPVVLALTGYPNDTINLMHLLHLPAIAARLTGAGQIRPAVYLMLNPSVALPRDTECTNIPAGPQVATFFGRDVPLAIEHAFRVRSARSGWSVIGYSTGAYCAAKLAMLYPDQFAAAVGMSGYYTAARDRTTGNLYGSSAAYRNENNLDWRLRHLPAPPVSVLVASSASGEKNLPGTLAFLHLIHPPMRGFSLILRHGGHNYFTWRRELPQALRWLSHLLTPALPGSAG